MTKTELVDQIKRYQDAYYNGQPLVSDAVFDQLWEELKALDPNNPLLTKVGKDSGDFPKAQHAITMGSQQKANSVEDMRKWLSQFDATKPISFSVQPKLDGCSIDLYYKNGKLQQCITRGDGYIGDLITSNAIRMKGCLPELIVDFSGSIRGEVLLLHEDKDRFYPDMANCRNAAAGIMKRKDGKGCENLAIYVYDLKSETDTFTTESDKILFLQSRGFKVVKSDLKTYQDLSIEFITESLTREMEAYNRIRDSLPFDIDGIVIKQDTCDQDDLNNLIPSTQIAYKFPREEAVTTLERVDWSLSNGTMTPVGVISPVYLCGTTVKQASLCNVSLIEEGNFRLGDKVIVTKRGEIIPKIEKVLEHVQGSTEIEIPEVCPECSHRLHLNDNHTKLSCENEDCISIKVGKLSKWVNILGIKELADITLRKLLEASCITGCIHSLYEINWEDVTALAGFGKRSAQVIKENLESVKEVFLPDFIAGFNIEGIGSKVAEKAIEISGAKTLEDLLQKKQSDFIGDGISDITASKLVLGLSMNTSDMRQTATHISIKNASTGCLVGLSVCFTGALSIKRSEAESWVKEQGGSVKSSVVKGLTYLVTNDPDSGSSKNEKAKKQGTKVISENEFRRLVCK